MAKKTPVSPRYCAARFPKPRVFPRGVEAGRARLIRQFADRWLNGSAIRYWFFDAPKPWVGSERQRNVVREAFGIWEKIGIGLDFVEVENRRQADVRIAFLKDDGAWSYIGRDVQTRRRDPRTMNFGWSLTADPVEGLDTALHEIGHTLGFPHEHQNPYAGIVWDEEAVYASLAAKPNYWDRATTFQNIIEKITPDEVKEGSDWDPHSIMHYPFEAGLIIEPKRYAKGLTPRGGISRRDREWARRFYPRLNPAVFPKLVPSEWVPLSLAPGQQANFHFEPTATRVYDFRTAGTADTVMALHASSAPWGAAIAEDDDSGDARNARFQTKLTAGRSYLLRVRLHYAKSEGESSVTVT